MANCDQKVVEDRWAKKNEAEEVPGDEANTIAEQGKAAEALAKEIENIIDNPKARINIQTDVTLEQLSASLRS